MTAVTYLSLADNELQRVPEHLWKKMPNVKTLDLGRTKISYLSETNFRVGIYRFSRDIYTKTKPFPLLGPSVSTSFSFARKSHNPHRKRKHTIDSPEATLGPEHDS